MKIMKKNLWKIKKKDNSMNELLKRNNQIMRLAVVKERE